MSDPYVWHDIPHTVAVHKDALATEREAYRLCSADRTRLEAEKALLLEALVACPALVNTDDLRTLLAGDHVLVSSAQLLAYFSDFREWWQKYSSMIRAATASHSPASQAPGSS